MGSKQESSLKLKGQAKVLPQPGFMFGFFIRLFAKLLQKSVT